MKIKVVSLNLSGYVDWRNRISLIANYLNRENPSLLLLQEVRFDIDESYLNQATELNQRLENPFAYESTSVSRFYRPSIGDPYREGLAILARTPILKTEVLALTQAVGDKHLRLIQNADIQLDSTIIKLSNIHLSNNEYSVQQLKELLDLYTKREEKRIIAGDFNILDLAGHKDLYKGYMASVDFSKYISFPAEGKTIDYMLLPDRYSYLDISVEEGLSDHTALSFILNIPSDGH